MVQIFEIVEISEVVGIYDICEQGVIFPQGVWVFPTGNLQKPQEILTKTLIKNTIIV